MTLEQDQGKLHHQLAARVRINYAADALAYYCLNNLQLTFTVHFMSNCIFFQFWPHRLTSCTHWRKPRE